MIVIRKEQMDVFRTAALAAFEDEMVLHLGTFSPPLFAATGEQQIRKAIRLGISRAADYGFDHQGPVRLYLEMMLLFGSDFDTDPQYLWVSEILTTPALGSQMWRAERCFERIQDYLKSVIGPDDAYALKALRNIRRLAENPPAPPSSDHLVAAMVHTAKEIHPEKVAYIGTAAVEALIQEANTAAEAYHFSTPHEIGLMVILMMAFGHGCDGDPLYPWIERTLKDEAIVSPSARAKRLESKALTWLDHVVEAFSGAARP